MYIMNVLAAPRHKCDLGNKNDSVTDKKITAWETVIIILRLYYIRPTNSI